MASEISEAFWIVYFHHEGTKDTKWHEEGRSRIEVEIYYRGIDL